ncbi:elongation factor P 5-aminopentanone reductase [Planomicrobium sp. CPCC 101079]|uniref:elongation factor P 5-aminopentanone reductase n=1 Tax=Planomicrobium sp. CPCC 101079 TaxID=2599618 RepID=UPI0011B4AFAC|nr:SDR family oxidoreductase [Planomicrobium sp. CPCC 101079]TWT04545.1 SDR family oxidoreductase [Planomicrobium sp. CPCC 101079]
MKKFAVILGASGEIGEQIARQLADADWSLYLHWNSKSLDNLAEEMKASYPNQEFIPVRADFSKSDAADKLAEQVFDASCVIIASGHALYKMLIDTTDADLEELWQVHVKNPMSAVRLLSPYFHRHSKSYVVFISSIWGEIGASMETAYSAVKGAQLSFVKAYAKEMAASGTRVNAISPGFIRTKMNRAWSEEELAAIEEEIPLGLGTPQDVANAVDFLVNGKADYMTGQTLRVNGGWHT